jgi:hypothetical protein
LVSKNKGERMMIICVLGGVTYAEIHQAAEIERRTGCTVLIGGSDILTRSDYLDRLSMDPKVRKILHLGHPLAKFLLTHVAWFQYLAHAFIDVGCSNDSGRVAKSSAGQL